MPVYKTKTEKTKDNKIWYFKCNYKDVYGNIKQKKSKKYATRDEALKEEAKFKLKQDEVSVLNTTMYDLYNAYFFLDDSIINRESTLYTKEYRVRKYILPFFINNKNGKYSDLSTVNVDKIKKWKIWLNEKKLSLQTKKSLFNTFSSLMSYAVEKYSLEYNPLKLVENFREKNDKVVEEEKVRFMTNEEYRIFIDEVDDDFKVVFHFLYEIGCRKGEMTSLKWKNVDLKNERVKLNTTFSRKRDGSLTIANTKNGKNKYVDMSPKLVEELTELYNKMKKLDGFSDEWFVFGGIKYLSYTTLGRKKDEAFERLKEKGINITNITIHEFRHSSASYMISNNIPIEVIAYRLGDTPETIRRTYAHLFPDAQKDVKGLFNNL
ncbi:MAG: tyrosine-type recombinase/integrase [Bacilli bacterium]